MFYIEEKQPSGKWKRGQFPYTEVGKAERMAAELDEHGSGIGFRVTEVVAGKILRVVPNARGSNAR